MDSMRKTALVAGALYLLTFISIPTLVLYNSVLKDPRYVLTAGGDTALFWGALLEVIVALAGIGTAVVLYPVVKRQNQAFALGFVGTRVLEASMIFIGVVSLLSLATLHQDVATTASADPATLVLIGTPFVATYNSAFLLGQTLMPAMNAFLLGYLMYKSGLVPRIIPTLGLIGCVLMASSVVGQIIGINEAISVWSGIALIPIFLWELSLGLYLLLKGFKKSGVLAIEGQEQRSAPAYAAA